MAGRDPRIIGTRIARRRHQLGWTQVELAHQLGVSPSTVANWERGASYPKKKFGLVEQVLGISLDSEAEGQPDPVPEDLQKRILLLLGERRGEFVLDEMRAAMRGEPLPPSPTGPASRPSGQAEAG